MHLPRPAAPAFRPPSRRAGRGAFTVVEATVAGAIITLFLTTLFALNSNMMRLLASASETASASQDLQQRVEQIRLANWTQISSPAWVQANLLGTMTDASVNLPGLTETITVQPYVSPCSTAPGSLPPAFTVTRSASGQVTVSPAGYASVAALQTQEMIEVDLTISWPSWRRTRNRSLTTLVSRWGISK